MGTFLPTFVTIPAVGTAVTFLIFSGILLLLALLYFFSSKAKRGMCAAALTVFVFCSIFGNSDRFAFWDDDLLYEGESVYNYLQVSETENSVILSTNVLFGVQSVMNKEEGMTGMYYDTAMAAPLMVERDTAPPETGSQDAESSDAKPLDVLILGMGSGTYARQCEAYFGNMNIEGVEIDEKITDLSRKYFDLPEDVEVTTYDGRAYLQAVDTKYDVIMVDAYQDITIPFQMSSREFFTQVRDHLKDGGVMVVNMNMTSEEEGNINDYLTDTIASVFDTVYTADVDGSTNRELFASQNPRISEIFYRNIPDIEDGEFRRTMRNVANRLVPRQGGDYILTDDKAPVELLGIQVIDGLIQDEASYYKDILDEEGIGGLLDRLA